jgi:tyrosyl-tRNA synthetase
MLTFQLLMGTDGRKMSKSWGNTVDVLDSPEDMFGKIMRISDEMLEHYIDVALEAPAADKAAWKQRCGAEPMEAKKWIARSITAMYHGAAVADEAQEHFRRTVQERSFGAEDIEDVELDDSMLAALRSDGSAPRLTDLIAALQLAPSKSEARRLIQQGGVKLDGETVSDPFATYEHRPGRTLQVGKRRIVRLNEHGEAS